MRLQQMMGVILLLVLGPLCRGQQMTQEEEAIRTTYAKLSYADEVRIILDAVQRTSRDKLWTTSANVADRALDGRLTFELGNFHFGKLKAIADRKVGDFDGVLSAIGGEVLDVTPSVFNYSANNSPSKYVSYVKFAWKASPYKFAPPTENWTVAKALRSEQFEHKQYTDYVTYTVTLTLERKSRTYNAWMLFRHDDKDKLEVYFMDAVADSTSVLFAYEHSMYPTAFAEADLRTVPFIDKWLYDNARACKARHNEKDDKTDVCCDPTNGRCGVAKSSLLPRNSRRITPKTRGPRILPASYHISSLPLRPLVQATTGCAKFNVNTTFAHGLGDSQEHSNDGGQHNFTATVLGSCTYTDGATSPGPCNVQCSAQSSSLMAEFGGLTGLAFVHATAKTDSSGGDFTNGGSAAISCLGVSAGTVKSCTFPCSTTISITAGGKGNLGATISFPTSQLWSDQNQGQLSCQPQSTAPTPTPTPAPPPPGGTCTVTRTGFTSNQTGDGTDDTDCSPIIIDLSGKGFFLTSAANGVSFDIRASGSPMKISWTAPEAANAFLAFDRNGNGSIDNGTELFGNVTPQPASAHPNGFLALAQYDVNRDGIIDARDPIYSALRLWIDANHDGISQPGELHTLPEMGVFSIGLDYSLSGRTDQFGNFFRYKAKVNVRERGDSVGKQIYDVFFVSN